MSQGPELPDPDLTAADGTVPTTPKAAPAPTSQQETVAPAGESAESRPQIAEDRAGLPSIPGYSLMEKLGHGGMGVVFKAVQLELKRVVAVKMLRSGCDAGEAQVQRFRIEAEAVARLDHPHIIAIYEVGEHQGQHFFSMKLVDGGSLASRRTQFSLGHEDSSATLLAEQQRRIACLLAKVARAVQCAHEQGILHRDLKPANILLDGKGEPHVADFGLAKRVGEAGVPGSEELTQTGVIVGTPSYMAPEQARANKTLTAAADVYSLGAILFELLTGQPPFQAATTLDTLLDVTQHEPPRPRALNGAVSRDLETICLKALAKDAERRYRSAAEFADELDRVASGQPIKARPVSLLERGWRRCRRNPLVAGLSGSVLVLLVVLGAVLVHYAWPEPAPRTDGSLDRVKAAGKVKIAIATNYPPMEFTQDGKLAGFDVDLIEAVAARLEVRPDYLIADMDWPDVPAALKERRCDLVIGTWTITSQRRQEAAFVEYLRMVQVFACARGISVKNEQELAGKVVAVGADSVQHRFVNGLRDRGLAIKEIKVIRGGEDPFAALKRGQAEVTISEEPVARYKARLDPADIVITGSVGHAMDPDPIGIVLRQQDRQLHDAVAEAIHMMKEDGTFGRILGKWFGR
jgi:eukaryotic-like serine/threonine-protein kinase